MSFTIKNMKNNSIIPSLPNINNLQRPTKYRHHLALAPVYSNWSLLAILFVVFFEMEVWLVRTGKLFGLL